MPSGRSSAPVVLSGDLTVETAVAVRDALWSRLGEADLEVELSGLGRIDLAALQLLVLFDRVRGAAGRATSIGGEATARFRAMAAAAGISLSDAWTR